MKQCYLIDTDILIDCLRGKQKALVFIESAMAQKVCFISAMSIAEINAGVREGQERQLLTQFLTSFEVVSLTRSIAEVGGLYRRDYGKSHGVGLADALIAACAQANDAQLATLNKKHYPMMAVHVPYRKT